MKKQLQCIVRGRVQMVMFRDFTTRKARKLGLVGTVQNRIDGTVAILAEGTEDDLQKLLICIHKGSILSRVDDVEVSWSDELVGFEKFTIKYV